MDWERYEQRIIGVTREALAEGATLLEISKQLAPLISRSTFYRLAQKWENEGRL